MKPIVGLELSANRIRAVTVSRIRRRPLRRFDIPWKDGSVHEAVRLLQEHLGSVSAIGIGVGMEFLLPKHIALPPVSAPEKRRIIALEPERFFAVSAPVVVAVSPSHDLVVAADASAVESWVTALESWAPVQNVTGAPSAFARASRALGLEDGMYQIASDGNARGHAEIRSGQLHSARLTRAGASDADAREIPAKKDIPGPFVVAFGAALGVSDSPDEMLVSEERYVKINASRTRSMVLAGLLAAASVMLLFFSAAQSRIRYLDRVDSAVAALRPRAATAQSLQGRIELMGLASNAAYNAQSGVDPLTVITVLSRRLPHDAVVMTLRGAGDEWQISGTAKDAAAIIPALDDDPAIDNVRFLAGTSRFTEGRRTYETYSIGFHVRPTTQ